MGVLGQKIGAGRGDKQMRDLVAGEQIGVNKAGIKRNNKVDKGQDNKGMEDPGQDNKGAKD